MQGSILLDADRNQFVLTGVQMQGLSYVDPDDQQQASIAALNSLTFRVIRQRWNLNTVRLTVNPAIWQRDGKLYLDRIAEIVRLANAENLVVNIAARNGSSPDASTAAFWSAAAAVLRDNPMLVFSVYARPEGTDWQVWRSGDGENLPGMQTLVDAIRSTGATQIIAVPALPDGFRGLSEDLLVDGSNLMYEVYPSLDSAITDIDRDSSFGLPGTRFPLYAAEWGAVPEGTATDSATETFYGLLYYFGLKSMSWAAASFESEQLIRDFKSFEPVGVGNLLMLWLTGDPYGFGSIAPDQVASAAGGPAGPVVPGQQINFYGQLVGPEVEVQGTVDDSTGRVSTNVGGTQVFFDDIAAPIVAAGYFSIRVQVPFELTGKTSTRVTAWHRGVSSNTIELAIASVAPGIFPKFGSITDAAAMNQNRSQNSDANPADVGSVVSLLLTGYGETSPAGITGLPARVPFAQPVLPVSLTIGGIDSEILSKSEAPGLIGVLQIDARVPSVSGGGSRTAPVVVTIGSRPSRPDVRIWVR